MPHPLLPLDGPSPWRTLEQRVAWSNGRLSVRDDRVIGPDGGQETYTFIALPRPVVAILPLTAEGEVYLVRQWRYPWARNSWEIPAGHADEGETPDQAARRELAEEVRLAADVWQTLGAGMSASAILAAAYHLYLARGLRSLDAERDAPAVRDSSEADMQVAVLPLADAVAAALDGTIVHAFSVMALLRAARLLGV